jgi:hypothetical protein
MLWSAQTAAGRVRRDVDSPAPRDGDVPPPGVGAPEPLLCTLCRDRIGVYEPAVWIVGSQVLRTSRAAHPHLAATSGGSVFHAGCFDASEA